MTRSVLKSGILFILSCIFSSLHAQHDFRPGSIVTNDNQILNGFIDYRPAQENSTSCNFKTDTTEAVKIYLPRELKEYSFLNGKRYITKQTKIDSIPAYYFLECLIEGTVNLYYLKNIGFDYYFIEESDNVYELTNDKISYVEGAKTYEVNSEKYKRVLSFVMKDSPGIFPEIQSTELNKKSLMKLITEYHHLINKPAAFIVSINNDRKKEQAKWIVKLGVGIGIDFSMLRAITSLRILPVSLPSFPSQPPPIYITGSNMPITGNDRYTIWSTCIVPTLFLNLNNNGKNSLQLELSFMRNNYSSKGFTIKSKGFISPLIYKREFRKYKKNKPFMDIGLSMHYDFKLQIENLYLAYDMPSIQNNQVAYVHNYYTVDKENIFMLGSTAHYGALGGLGISRDLTKKNSMDLELRVEMTGQAYSSYFGEYVSAVSRYRYWNFALLARFSL